MKRSGLLVAALLALYWILAVSTSPRMGVTTDEVVHLTAGYSYWKTNDYRLQPENGTLAMRAAALPLLAMDLRWVDPASPDWLNSNTNRVGADFFHHFGNPLPRMLLAARGAIALLGVLALWLTWRWARGLFGARAGWLALGLAVFCPALLAHGALATSDMAITAALLAVVSIFWRLMHVVTWGRLALTGLAGGAVLLAKMSGVLAAPMLGLLLLWRWTRPAPLVVHLGGKPRWVRGRSAVIGLTTAAAVVAAVASIGVLWAGYSFRYSAFSEKPPGTQFVFTWEQILEEAPMPNAWPGDIPSRMAAEMPPPSPTAGTRAITWMRDHRLLPESYLWGMAHTYKFSRSRPAFLNGEFRLTGWPEFFPWTFWLKTTLPALALLGVGIAAVARSPRRARWLYRAAPLLVLFGVYWAVALRTHLNIGHRHILPTYPVVYVFAGAAVLWLLNARISRLVGAGLVLALVAHAADSTLARPFYLSYFQPLGGGQRGGWRHLVDSSYDWGQGVPELQRWLAARATEGDRTPVYITYSGSDLPPVQPPRVIRFADEVNDSGPRGFPVRSTGGWFAISATHFQRVYLRIPGPWSERYEAFYQQTRTDLAQLASVANPDPATQARLLRAAMDFEVLEFGRLCHYLRARDPLEIVGGSILIFRLTDAEVAFALNAPLSAFPAP